MFRGNKERMDLWAYLVHLDIWENLVRLGFLEVKDPLDQK